MIRQCFAAYRLYALVAVFCIGLSSCAFDLAHVSFVPANLMKSEHNAPAFRLAEAVRVTTQCGFNRVLNNGSTWEMLGSIEEGAVYRSRSQALTLECSNVHEAYLVVSNGALVGFYLPVEKGFAKLYNPVVLPVQK